jgi:hypothetical protein
MTDRFHLLRSSLLIAAGIFIALFLCLSSPAQAKKKKVAAPAPVPAASAATPDGEADKDQTKVKIERGAGGKKVYRIEGEIVIEGKIQKPEAFYVLQKSSINYDWHELKQDFVPKILESVSRSPF